MDIGKSLKLALIDRGMSQIDLANTMLVSRSWISAVATNKISPSLKKVEMMAAVFGMKVSEFIKVGE